MCFQPWQNNIIVTFQVNVLQSSAEKDGGEVINDFDIEEEEILIEHRLFISLFMCFNKDTLLLRV